MSERFDDLARAIADPEAVGRRKLLRRALAAVGVGAGVTVLGERSASAAKPAKAVNCPPGLTNCDGLCRDTSSHPDHCGACGNVCGSDSVCRNGTCVKVACDCGPIGCGPGLTDCGGSCVNLQTDGSHCGACGSVCPSGTTCSGGTCVSTGDCPPGTAECDGGCVDVSTDVQNCGACGNACVFPNATGTCAQGVCQIAACNAGFADCDGNPATGCETNVTTSTSNCGACGNVCPPGAVCQNGQCVSTCTPMTCSQLGAQCGAVSDGCGGVLNCGSCPTGTVCQNNVCVR